MVKDAPRKDVRWQIGQAIALLRTRAGLTQAQAADRVPPKPGSADPGMTSQYWGMHENGKVKGLIEPEVQGVLLAAIGATPRDLDAALEELGDDGSANRLARIARELGGEASQPAHAPSQRQAVFPLPEGDVVITLPANLSPAGFKQLEDYLAVFLSPNKAKAN